MALEKYSYPEQISPLEEQKNRLSIKFISQSDYSDSEKSQIEKRLGLLGGFADPKLSHKLKKYQEKYPKKLWSDGTLWPKTAEFILSQDAITEEPHKITNETAEKLKAFQDQDAEKPLFYSELPDGTKIEWRWKADYKEAFDENMQVHGKNLKARRPDGSIMEGNWEHGVFTWPGTFTDKYGNVYRGHWWVDAEGKLALSSGTIKTLDGSLYTGEIRKLTMHGKGVLRNPEWQISYDGDWKNGRKNWIGKWYKDGIMSYDWEWKDNKLDGQWTLYQKDGKTVKYAWTFYQNKYIRV